MKVAVIGLPQSGKSTFFHALTGPSGSRNKGDLSIGMVSVPDERLDRLTDMFEPGRTIHAVIELVEAHAPSLGSRDGSVHGLDAAFLNMVKPMDAFLLVTRSFDGEGMCDPAGDVETVISDLVLADLIVIEGRLERIEENRRKGKEEMPADEKRALEQALVVLNDGRLIHDDPELAAAPSLRSYAFLTARPLMVVANVAEEDLERDQQVLLEGIGLPVHGLPSFTCCAGIEQEIGDLPPAERDEFMEAMGVKESVLDVVIRKTYSSLGLISFLTVGKDEVRAWAIREGTPALKAAGSVHSDMERGFIRAEVIEYNDLISMGSEAAVKKAGKARLEGRDYPVRDGDVINFRFAV